MTEPPYVQCEGFSANLESACTTIAGFNVLCGIRCFRYPIAAVSGTSLWYAGFSKCRSRGCFPFLLRLLLRPSVVADAAVVRHRRRSV